MTRQEELEGMSDSDLAVLVALAEGYKFAETHPIYDGRTLIESSFTRDYCNNPTDIMPIAIENRISLDLGHEACGAYVSVPDGDGGADCYGAYDKNPLRAICIVFILMKESE